MNGSGISYQPKVLVTGSEGFIGSYLVKKLLAKGYEVLTLDLLENLQTDGRTLHYKLDLSESSNLEVLKDINFDVLFHLAAQTSVQKSQLDPENDLKINALGTLNLIKWAEKHPPKKFIYVNSGGAIYDPKFSPPFLESSKIGPISPYGLSKYFGERYLFQLLGDSNIDVVSLRLSNVFGPSLHSTSIRSDVISVWINAVLHGDEIVIRNYESTRDYIHVSDVVSALILAAKSKYAGVYNVSSGIETSLRQILEIIVETISPTPVKLVEEEQNSFEIVYSALSNLSFRETFSWNPKTNVQSGIKQMLEHFKSP